MEEQLKKLDDAYFKIVWNTDFGKDHPFVRWFNLKIAPHCTPELVSNHVKAFETYQKAIKLNQDYFMCCDDDVVFPKNLTELIKNFNFQPISVICMGVNYDIPYGEKTVTTGNIGGCECIVISRQFAQFLLDNVDMNQTIDIVISAILVHSGKTLDVTPFCHQTSLLEYRKTSHTGSTFEKNWVNYIRDYKPSGLKYSKIKEEFEKFMERKKFVEARYKELFDVELDIWNLEYIDLQYQSTVFSRSS